MVGTGAVVLVSLTHLATTLNMKVAKASIHHQLEMVGAPTHLCDTPSSPPLTCNLDIVRSISRGGLWLCVVPWGGGAPPPNICIQQEFAHAKYTPQQLKSNYGLRAHKPSLSSTSINTSLIAFKRWSTNTLQASRTSYSQIKHSSMVYEEAHVNQYLGFNSLCRGDINKPSLLVGLLACLLACY